VHVCVRVYACVCVRVCACMCVWLQMIVRVCVYVCVYIHICMHISMTTEQFLEKFLPPEISQNISILPDLLNRVTTELTFENLNLLTRLFGGGLERLPTTVVVLNPTL